MEEINKKYRTQMIANMARITNILIIDSLEIGPSMTVGPISVG